VTNLEPDRTAQAAGRDTDIGPVIGQETLKQMTHRVTTTSDSGRRNAMVPDRRQPQNCRKQIFSDFLGQSPYAWRAEGQGFEPLSSTPTPPPPGQGPVPISETGLLNARTAAKYSSRHPRVGESMDRSRPSMRGFVWSERLPLPQTPQPPGGDLWCIRDAS
jgi:hypothetical protein